MTGTADTEAFELKQIYGLGVLVIPTHKPMVRDDRNDLIYMSAAEKYQAIIEDIKQQVKQGRPVLVGTTSIETSEYVSSLLNKSKIKHQVLNAKYHEREAEIIAQAGRPGTVTIATNMAGRGTDIKLGGNWEMQVSQLNPADEAKIAQVKADWQTLHEQVVTAGGLHIIGTERHESRRIDNQLRGRAGRQGDPGSSRFYLSLEDNLMRIFASDRIKAMMSRLGMKEGESIEHAWANRAVENAQRKVESRNFDIRKQLLEYDDVANDQRQVVYKNRQELLEAEDVTETIASMEHDVLNEVLASYIPPQSIEEQWDIEGLELHLKNEFQLALPVSQWLKDDDELHEDNLKQKIIAAFKTHYDAKMAAVDPELLKQYEKHILLERLDHFWKEHLANMDHLRQGIHLRGYAQRNPKQEYKREAFDLFQGMLQSIRHDVIRVLANIEIRQPEDVSALEQQRRMASVQQVNYQHGQVSALAEPQQEAEGDGEKPQPVVRQGPKVGRNEPCPCGSGRKYKHCHGRL
jgi:preprotein translocase subunit SecA